MKLRFILNGQAIELEAPPEKRLIDLLREDLHLTGAKEGCGEGECGSCTVLLDDAAVHACLVLAGQIDGHSVTTIEGLGKDGDLDPLQTAFIENMAIQCGYCTPGMIMAARGLLLKNLDPSEAEIRNAISGNICRCAGYTQIIQAIQAAAKAYRKEAQP